MNAPNTALKKVIVVGGGFAGIDLINLLSEHYAVTLFDRFNYHSFQPLLYQVATGGLESGSIAYPLRKIFSSRPNTLFRMASVTDVVPEQNCIRSSIGDTPYDYLVLATGTVSNYFGNADFERYTLPLKTVPNAVDLRSSVLRNLERALTARDEVERKKLLTFLIIGGGATGVEVAGALSELRSVVIPEDYAELMGEGIRIVLVEGGDRLLGGMSEKSSAAALSYLQSVDVEVMLSTTVKNCKKGSALLSNGIELFSETIVWASGVRCDAPKGLQSVEPKHGRLVVDRFNRVEGYENIFALGDLALMKTEAYPEGHPQLASVAKQQGVALGKNLNLLARGKEMRPFEYFDKGALATLGRNHAVADFKYFSVKGFVAWLLWLFVHIFFLVGFRNKVLTLFDWAWSYFSYDRAVRIILRAVPSEEK